MIIFFFIFVQGCILRHASTCPWQEENCIFNLTFLSTQIALTVDTLHKKVEFAKAWTQSNLEIYFFIRLPQSPNRYTSLQGDFNRGASSQADFILNYFLSNFLNFPQFSPNFLKSFKFSNSSQPGRQAGTIKATLPACRIKGLKDTLDRFKNCHLEVSLKHSVQF